jgi:hypothetical protein
MPAEESHEAGRSGVVRAKHLLWQVLGDAIDLPFNAYDHGPKLTFDDTGDIQSASFSFDLKGILRRDAKERASGQETVEVFVEVKSRQRGNDLLREYEIFLRRAAIVSSDDRHRDTWFIFLAGAPFGTTVGRELCDGSFLSRCRENWEDALKRSSGNLEARICLLISTPSLERLLDRWGRNRG